MQRWGTATRRVLVACVATVAVTTSVGLSTGAQAAAPAVVGAKVNTTSQGDSAWFRSGERIWVRGKVTTASGKALARKKVVVSADTGRGFRKVATVTTSTSGWFTFNERPSATTRYRASASGTRSGVVTVTRGTQPRSLESRAAALAFAVGKRTSDIQTATRADKPLRWASYEKGMLVSTGHSTWWVDGRIHTAYVKAGGPAGKLGGPIKEFRCSLYEGGCIQRFQNGVIYVNSKAKKKAVVVYGTAKALTIVAAAQSQVGYREPAYRKSKYNRWMHRTGRADAWCGYFLAWASRASGNGNAVIKAKTFAGMVAAEKRRGGLSSEPAVGKLAYIDYFRNKRSTHIGIVVKHKGSTIWTVEGNVSAGGRSGYPRGVRLVKRSESQVRFYAWPKF